MLASAPLTPDRAALDTFGFVVGNLAGSFFIFGGICYVYLAVTNSPWLYRHPEWQRFRNFSDRRVRIHIGLGGVWMVTLGSLMIGLMWALQQSG